MNTISRLCMLIFGRVLLFGVSSSARGVGARVGADVLDSQRELASQAAATLDAADAMKVADDEIRKEVADLLSRGVADTVRTYQRFANFELTEDEAKEALVANPFSAGSEPDASLSPRDSERKAVEGPGAGEGGAVKRRGPGRPPGAKNRPKNPGQASPAPPEDRTNP